MDLKTTSRRATLGAVTAAFLLAAATLPAHAQDDLILLEKERVTMYQNGGIGQDEQAAMRKTAKDWPLRIVFSERKDNEFAANVKLFVTDQRGAPMLLLDHAGPMTYAMLPAGKYRVTATKGGVTESREVMLDGKQGRDVYFHWAGKPKVDPWDGKPIGGAAAPG
ncbi:hypothetical protein [Pseudorhodoferax sp. Leaf274]|uniref:hypothetical protein n=1 Tax=Pseudorhodoferax sp. Leaf274 TaxID=1736318 RepID=UPI000702C98E|nr:hypothetical protein [Pseudorhodoferax sp. Leaf274]KQP39897.1 hypothetical protein ASF44_09295 [Pseudorhodoferax sp. Leaf274]